MDLKSFISIDTETTGLNFEEDRVIQFGASVFLQGREVLTDSFYIQCDVENKGGAVNQISEEDIAGGMDPMTAFLAIATILEKAVGNAYPRILAYNAPFDLGMLTAELRRRHIEYDLSKCHILDPLVMWRHFHPFRKGKLENVSSFYQIPNLKAHDAGADAACAGHVYLKMLERYGILHNPYITDMQKGWHETWAQGMRQWAEGKDQQITIEPWPTREEWVCYRQESEPLFSLEDSS